MAVIVATLSIPRADSPIPSAAAADDLGPVFFRKPDLETAQSIHKLLNLFGSPAPSDRERGRDGLFDIGFWSVPRLIEKVREDASHSRSNAILVLGRLNDPLHGKLNDLRIHPALRDTVGVDARSEWPPALAALMLGRMKDADDATFEAFRLALAAREGEKRRVAVALALGRMATERETVAGDMLEGMLRTRLPTPDARFAALLALGFFPRRVAEVSPDRAEEVPSPLFRQALADSSSGIRRSAVLGLSISRRDAFHPVFVETFRRDGEKEVRLAALLAVGARRDAETTKFLISVLQTLGHSGEEQIMAAYLLSRRADPTSIQALIRTAKAPGGTDLQGAALLALGSMDDSDAEYLVLEKLTDRSATVRSAAAVAITRFPTVDSLKKGEQRLRSRLISGETDGSARENMRRAADHVAGLLDDRTARAAGKEPPPRATPKWDEIDASDLFRQFERDERETLMDLVNRWAETIIGIAGLLEYRTHTDFVAGDADTPGRARRPGLKFSEQYDLALDLDKRPYYDLQDLPRFMVPVQPGDRR
jgi:HEAT repeat protein